MHFWQAKDSDEQQAVHTGYFMLSVPQATFVTCHNCAVSVDPDQPVQSDLRDTLSADKSMKLCSTI